VDLLERILPDYVVVARRDKATAAMTLMAGALTLSRSVDNDLARQILKSAEISVLALCGVDQAGPAPIK
jgi:hypothetical protein